MNQTTRPTRSLGYVGSRKTRLKYSIILVVTALVAADCSFALAQRSRRTRGAITKPRIEPEDLTADLGTDRIPDQAAFDRMSYQGTEVARDAYLADLQFVKFCVDNFDPDQPKIYFMNTANYRAHPDFMQRVGIFTLQRGAITFLPRLANPSGEAGLFIVDFEPRDSYSFEEVKGFLDLLTQHMPMLEGRVAFHPLRGNIARYEEERAKYQAAGLAVHLDADLYSDIAYLPLNSANGFGTLRLMTENARPSPRDVVIYRTLPNEMPRTAGVITEVRQTPLSHVNLRAIQDRIPNAYIKEASSQSNVKALIGKLVQFQVTPQGYKLREATQDELNNHFASLRPNEVQIPVRQLAGKEAKPLSEISFEHSSSFGVKTANVATLRTITMPANVPDGFGVPFYFYDEFMKFNGFYDELGRLLELPEFAGQTDRDEQMKRLDEFRTKIKSGKMPPWMLSKLETVQKQFPAGTSIRCRSSTNNEDLPGFSGAGLYDSFTHKPTEGHLSKSIKQVYASLWNFRAFEEREFYRVDHQLTAMGVLLHPNFKGEKANGVAVTSDVLYETSSNYYLNSQIGEDLVTNPDEASSPEEGLLGWWKEDGYQIVRRSAAVNSDTQLLADSHLAELRKSLGSIHNQFAKCYSVDKDDERFAMEVEYKISKGGELFIKQARPWVFSPEK